MITKKTKKMTWSEFFDHCYCRGGNWIAMLLTGVENCFPDVYERIKNVEFNDWDGYWKLMDIIEHECGVVRD